ncbi:ATP-binding protein [Nocardiopsis synnemataformans]|uniref:ATP-binding protein n=1 Tax=Nocardiopsis synnemataformans TaxID=61305 RepID=UPI003EBB9584
MSALLPGVSRLADVELVLTELVTSAIRASDADITITVDLNAEVRIEVHDQRGQHPRADEIHIDPETPDGIAIVSAVADRFGSRRHRSGDCTTWAVLSP